MHGGILDLKGSQVLTSQYHLLTILILTQDFPQVLSAPLPLKPLTRYLMPQKPITCILLQAISLMGAVFLQAIWPTTRNTRSFIKRSSLVVWTRQRRPKQT